MEPMRTQPGERSNYCRTRAGRPWSGAIPPRLLPLLMVLCTACAQVPSRPNAGLPAETDATAAFALAGSGDGRLEKLRRRRTVQAQSNKLGIGPGDVIDISVAGVPELKEYKVRVSENGTIAVPLAGTSQVNGLSEEELRKTLCQELAKPIKDPQVEVFVEKYHSRQVAVVGMVYKPGLYTIDGRSDTVLAMIDRAGGLTAQASSRVLFIPATASADAQPLATIANAMAGGAERDATRVEPVGAQKVDGRESAEKADRVTPSAVSAPAPLALPAGINPIEIDLTRAAREGQLAVPVRPGDTIIVPAAGEVMVGGWVANPGAFRIMPGMTALGAISAAGGALFSESAEVLRAGSDGSRRSIAVDLSRVKSGQEEDVPVVAGDVVLVRRSALGAVPYAVYEIFTKFATGMYLPPP